MRASLAEGATLDVLLRDGSIARLRRPTEQDEAAVTVLDRDSRLLRDSSANARPGGWSASHLTRAGRARSGLVAVLDGAVVAAGSFTRLERSPDEAELVVVVDAAHLDRGLGTLLVEHLVVLGRAAGVTAFLVSGPAAVDATMAHVVTDSGLLVTPVGTDGRPRLRVDLLAESGSPEWAT